MAAGSLIGSYHSQLSVFFDPKVLPAYMDFRLLISVILILPLADQLGAVHVVRYGSSTYSGAWSRMLHANCCGVRPASSDVEACIISYQNIVKT